MQTSSNRAGKAWWVRISGLLAGALLAAGCGPAPWAQDPGQHWCGAPAPAAPREADPGTVVVVVGEPPRAAPAAEPEDKWVPDAFPRPNPFERARTWTGDYDCAQGTTGLALRIVDVRGRAVRAIFDFQHVRSGAAGSYIVTGVYEPSTRRVVFEPGAWIVRPDDYVTVGMEGEVARDGSLFAGRITFPGCGGFKLKPGL